MIKAQDHPFDVWPPPAEKAEEKRQTYKRKPRNPNFKPTEFEEQILNEPVFDATEKGEDADVKEETEER